MASHRDGAGLQGEDKVVQRSTLTVAIIDCGHH